MRRTRGRNQQALEDQKLAARSAIIIVDHLQLSELLDAIWFRKPMTRITPGFPGSKRATIPTTVSAATRIFARRPKLQGVPRPPLRTEAGKATPWGELVRSPSIFGERPQAGSEQIPHGSLKRSRSQRKIRRHARQQDHLRTPANGRPTGQRPKRRPGQKVTCISDGARAIRPETYETYTRVTGRYQGPLFTTSQNPGK
jgi:hypothetical protein